LADLQVVYPDQFYFPTGTAQSRTIDTLTAAIRQATLTADYQFNGGSVQFYLTNDGGTTWAPVTPGISHVFTSTGSDLRWKAVLNVDPVRTRTPVVHSLRIDYTTQLPYADTYEPDDTCAQAQPIQINGAAQRHRFHQPDDSDWVWFDAQAGTTYTAQVANTEARVDTIVDVSDECGQPPLDTSDNAFGPGTFLTFQVPTSGRYYLVVYQKDGTIYGDETGYDLSLRVQPTLGAAIIVAGRRSTSDTSQPIISASANLAYAALLQHGFSTSSITYLNADTSQAGVDDVPTHDNIRDAIQEWARSRVDAEVPLWLYLVDHGEVDRFNNEVGEVVTAGELDLWLSNLEATSGVTQINVIIDTCHSGSFIDTYQDGVYGLAEISNPGRVIVSSTGSQEPAYAPNLRSGQPIPTLYFSGSLWRSLNEGGDVWHAFLEGQTSVEEDLGQCSGFELTCQHPRVDDTGDAQFTGADGIVAQGRSLPPLTGIIVPYIDWVEVSDVREGRATLRAQVRDDRAVAQVWARIFAPSFAPLEGTEGNISLIDVPEVVLTWTSGDIFTAEYGGFTEEGRYQVVVYARDDEGHLSMPQRILTGGGTVYLPLVLRGE